LQNPKDGGYAITNTVPVFFKLLRTPGIDSKESISPANVTWRAGTSNRVVVLARQAGNQFLGSLQGLQIRAPYTGR
jgi:hypothetical protein